MASPAGGPSPSLVASRASGVASLPPSVPSDPWSPGPRSGINVHLPPLQLPLPVAQGTPSGWWSSEGQVAALPPQVSWASHSPAALRQTVETGSKLSRGQVAELPLQDSRTSHGPAEGRQTAVTGLN